MAFGFFPAGLAADLAALVFVVFAERGLALVLAAVFELAARGGMWVRVIRPALGWLVPGRGGWEFYNRRMDGVLRSGLLRGSGWMGLAGWVLFAGLSVTGGTGQLWAQAGAPASGEALAHEVHADMDFLADDELHGRGSGTRDEHLAALFCAQQMEALGLEPGAPGGGYVLRAPLGPPSDRELKREARLQLEDVPRTETWDAVGILRGSDPALKSEVVLLTAHLDHLGMKAATAADADKIYNGADDDASGTTAVLALMRHLAEGPRPKRTVVFALFGSEEMGGPGNAAFLAQPPVPLASIVANLEFEMMGQPDPAVPEGTLWLTGFERTDLGPELAKHGAHLVADPHPEQKFFMRSDNYALAKTGIVAQTVSSYGLHKDYHQPSDELSKIDFGHMVTAIASMEAPVEWLVNTGWKPGWSAGGRP